MEPAEFAEASEGLAPGFAEEWEWALGSEAEIEAPACIVVAQVYIVEAQVCIVEVPAYIAPQAYTAPQACTGPPACIESVAEAEIVSGFGFLVGSCC